MYRPILCSLILALGCVAAKPAHAHATNVGLGVAAGLNYSWTKLKQGDVERDVGTGFAWGFFVDIPLLDTFYISPAAILYEADLGTGRNPVTDIDLNFKFIVPIRPLRLGAGATVGISNAEGDYQGHYGVLALVSVDVVANLEAFILAQYKRLLRDEAKDTDNLHGFVGAMFRF